MRHLRIMLLLLGFAALVTACAFGRVRIGEEQSDRYAEKNRDFAATLPVPPGAEPVTEAENECAGAYQHEATSACSLLLTYQTTEPLIAVMTFYDDYFTSEGWTSSEIDSEVNEYYEDGEFLIQVGVTLGIPLGICPDVFDDPEGNERCEAEEIRRDDGKVRTFGVIISPD